MTIDIVPSIELESVLLRQLRQEDATDIFEIYSDREAMKYRANPPLATPDDAREMIGQSLALAQSGTSFRWGIEEKNSGKIIGTFLWKTGNAKTLDEIGYSLHRQWWNRGLMSAIAAHMIRYLFQHYPIESLIAKSRIENISSIRLLEKLGFEKTGELTNSTLTFRLEKSAVTSQ